MNAQIINDLPNLMKMQKKVNWQPYSENGRHNVEIYKLYDDRNEKNVGPAAALMKYNPGAWVTKHIHTGYELIYVIEGELINDTGVHKAGTLEICPPGSSHSLSSKTGCVFLVVWEQPVKTDNEYIESMSEVFSS